MRYNVPSGQPALAAAQLIIPPTARPGLCVKVQNVSAVPVWVGDSQSNLDGSVDVAGTPNYGFVLQPVGNPGDSMDMEVVTTGLWARSAAPNGSVEASGQENC